MSRSITPDGTRLMCELLVYARVDGPEDELHPMRYRPGDVVPVDVYWLPLHGYGPPLRGNRY